MTINGKTSLDIVLAGVGGQGTLVAGRILGALAQALGLDAKVSEVHGMSQRGGSVITYARLGEKVHSPILERGQADFLLAFEELEALRWAGLLRRDGAALISTQRVTPRPSASEPRPIRRTSRTPGNACGSHHRCACRRAGLRRAVAPRRSTIIMLGAMAAMTDVPVEAWHGAIDHAGGAFARGQPKRSGSDGVPSRVAMM